MNKMFTLFGILIFVFSGTINTKTSPTPNLDCNSFVVYMNCITTAEQQYLAGHYTWEVYMAFVDDYCLDAAYSCEQPE